MRRFFLTVALLAGMLTGCDDDAASIVKHSTDTLYAASAARLGPYFDSMQIGDTLALYYSAGQITYMTFECNGKQVGIQYNEQWISSAVKLDEKRYLTGITKSKVYDKDSLCSDYGVISTIHKSEIDTMDSKESVMSSWKDIQEAAGIKIYRK